MSFVSQQLKKFQITKDKFQITNSEFQIPNPKSRIPNPQIPGNSLFNSWHYTPYNFYIFPPACIARPLPK